MISLTWGVINEMAKECFYYMTYQVPVKFTNIRYTRAKRMQAAPSAQEPGGHGGVGVSIELLINQCTGPGGK